MSSAGLGAFPAVLDGLEVDGLGVGVNDIFFFKSDQDPPFSFCKDSSDLCHVDIDESGSKVKSNHCSFQRSGFPLNHVPPLLPSERILDLSSCQ